MLDGYHFAYIAGDFLIGFPVFAVIFYLRKDLRREMLIAGVLLGILSLITETWYLRDYWHPESGIRWRISLGDFFYGFFFGGIASVVYEAILGRYFGKRKNHRHHWRWFVIPFFILGGFLFIAPLHAGINSIYTSSLAGLIIATIFLFYRKDLLWDTVMSSLLFGGITFVGYLAYLAVFPGIINAWWDVDNVSGLLVAGIPLEELIFALGMGAVVGPAYEFFTGLQFKKAR